MMCRTETSPKQKTNALGPKVIQGKKDLGTQVVKTNMVCNNELLK